MRHDVPDSSTSEEISLFSHPEEAILVERPNRFLMIVRDSNGCTLKAHCPNPGKLTEFIVPGQALLIERHENPDRTTQCTAVAVRYKGKTIPLYSAKANLAAKELILPRLYPGTYIIPEWTSGSSRFDFLLKGDPDRIIEVKSCSLVEHGLGMFPDTPTDRGSRHLQEMISHVHAGYRAAVLFIISHPDAAQFMPNPHTDPEFCIHLHRASNYMPIYAVSMATDPKGYSRIIDTSVPVDTAYPASLAKENCGVYLLMIQLAEPLRLPISSLDNAILRPGWYMYVGSAKKHLHQRIARHKRAHKHAHWHIDYLTMAASSAPQAYPISTRKDLECELAKDAAHIADKSIAGFGCSDCSCRSHLFFFTEKPTNRQAVVDLLFYYRHVKFRESESR